jgi:hypothetical protein
MDINECVDNAAECPRNVFLKETAEGLPTVILLNKESKVIKCTE